MNDQHHRYKLEICFTVCEGLSEKVFEEIKNLRNHIEKDNPLSHASNLKIYTTHKPITEKFVSDYDNRDTDNKEIQNG